MYISLSTSLSLSLYIYIYIPVSPTSWIQGVSPPPQSPSRISIATSGNVLCITSMVMLMIMSIVYK